MSGTPDDKHGELHPDVLEAIRVQMVNFGEIPDRTSPDDFPEGYVLTREEIVSAFVKMIEADRATRSATRLSEDTERLNWLERMMVEARQPLVHGSHQLFIASPEPVEGADDEPSDIRAQIDYQRNGGVKPPRYVQPRPAEQEEIYCHACSKAGGADREITHLPPACKSDDDIRERKTP